MGWGGSTVGAGAAFVTTAGVETGLTLSGPNGATGGAIVGADSGIVSDRARIEGVGDGTTSFGDGVAGEVAPGPQATKTNVHTKR